MLAGRSYIPLLRRMALMFSRTPLHPQWFSFRAKDQALNLAALHAKGALLDIGCGNSSLRQRVSGSCSYVALDYPLTGRELYAATPDVFGDAASLPFKNASFDVVALLDVLEHLPEPRAALAEIRRVLNPTGLLLVNVPFMYPLHDEPFDYQRLTSHGLKHALRGAGLRVKTMVPRGAPSEAAALMANIALSQFVVRSIHRLPLALVLVFPLVPIILFSNFAGWLLGLLARGDGLMPIAYWIEATPDAGAPGEAAT